MQFYNILGLTCLAFMMNQTQACIKSSNPVTSNSFKNSPRGWISTFESYNCSLNPDNCLSEILIKKNAQYMVSTKLLDSGYDLILITDGWMASSRQSNQIVPDPTRFPGGISALVTYLNSLNIRVGLQINALTGESCKGFLGSGSYLFDDYLTLLSWKVNLIHIDGCGTDFKTFMEATTRIGLANQYRTNKAEISISYNKRITENEMSGIDWDTIKKIFYYWDFSNDTVNGTKLVSMIKSIDKGNDFFKKKSAYGSWYYQGNLLVGRNEISLELGQKQIIFYCSSSSPIFISADLQLLSYNELEALQNKPTIQMCDDSNVNSISYKGSIENFYVWRRDLNDGTSIIIIYSFEQTNKVLWLNLAQLSFSQTNPNTGNSTYTLQNINTGSVTKVDSIRTDINFIIPLETTWLVKIH